MGGKSTVGETDDGGCTPGVVVPAAGVVDVRDGKLDGVVVVVVSTVPANDEGNWIGVLLFGKTKATLN